MTSPTALPRAFLGTALHTPRRGLLECLADTLIECDADGRIADAQARSSCVAQTFRTNSRNSSQIPANTCVNLHNCSTWNNSEPSHAKPLPGKPALSQRSGQSNCSTWNISK